MYYYNVTLRGIFLKIKNIFVKLKTNLENIKEIS